MSITENNLQERYSRYATATLVAMLSSQLLMFGVTKLLTNGLSQDSFGLYAILISLGSQIGSISSSIFTNGLWRYVEKYTFQGKSGIILSIVRKAVFVSILIITGAICIFYFVQFGFSIMLFDIQSNVYIMAIGFMGAYAISQAIMLILTSYSQGDQNAKLIILTLIGFGLTTLIAAIIGIILFAEVIAIFGVISLCLMIVGIVIFLVILKGQPTRPVEFSEIKEVVSFAAPLAARNFMVSNVIIVLLFFALEYDGFQLSAIISLGYSVLTLLTAVVQNLYSAFRQYAIAIHESDEEDSFKVSKIFLTSLPVVAVLFVGILWMYILAPELVLLLSTEAYSQSADFVRLSLPAVFILWIGHIYGTIGNYLSENVKLEFISALVSFTVMVLVALLVVPSMPLVGIAISYLVFCVSNSILNLIFGNIVYRRTIQFKEISQFGIIAICTIILHWIIMLITSNMIIAGIFSTVFFTLSLFKFGLVTLDRIPIKFPYIRSKRKLNQNS